MTLLDRMYCLTKFGILNLPTSKSAFALGWGWGLTSVVERTANTHKQDPSVLMGRKKAPVVQSIKLVCNLSGPVVDPNA